MRVLYFLLILCISSAVNGCSSDNETDIFSPPEIAVKEKQDLQFLREEEKLARDVYLYAYDLYEIQLFNNIAQSEQSHMNSLLNLLIKYDIPDPVIDERGKFSNKELQALYDQLTAKADISMTEALIVGATIEDLDINDIDDFETRTTKSDILQVYGRLKCGSRNHLRSFTNQLKIISVSYEPQFISNDAYNAIIATENERCGGGW